MRAGRESRFGLRYRTLLPKPGPEKTEAREPFPETNLLSGAGSNGRVSLRPKSANDGREGE